MIPSVRIRIGDSVQPMPDVWRANVMATHADAEALAKLLALPGRLGFIRMSLQALSDVEQFEARLRATAAQAKTYQDRGADVVVMLGYTPRWLSSRMQDESTTGSGVPVWAVVPPFGAFTLNGVAARCAEVFSVHGVHPWWEFWNEPGSLDFWRGTHEQLFALYASAAQAIRTADPLARVGGMGFDRFWDPMCHQFIDWCAANQPPLDFLSWHAFAGIPEHGTNGPGQVRGWLRTAGLPESLPQLVTESAPWTIAGNLDPFRDTPECVAFTLEALHLFERAGARAVLRAALQDFGAAQVGGFGLLTKGPCTPKPAWSLHEVLAQLGPNRLPIEIRDTPHGVNALAARDAAGHVRQVIHRYDPAGPDQVRVYLGGLSGRSQLLGRIAHFFV